MKLSFTLEGEIRTSSDKQKLREFVTGRLVYKKWLSSLRRRKMMQVRNLDLYKERKNDRERINKGKIKSLGFFILN